MRRLAKIMKDGHMRKEPGSYVPAAQPVAAE
jgi:hypothetical protein